MTSKDIYNVLQNITPPTSESCSPINFIVDMFIGKTRQERSDVDIQRRPKQKAYSQMVMSEENETASNEPSQMVTVKVASQRAASDITSLEAAEHPMSDSEKTKDFETL
jgi:hypothetical protein